MEIDGSPVKGRSKMREEILENGKRRLLAAMLWRGMPTKPVDHESYGTMRSAWLSAFPKHRGTAFLAGDAFPGTRIAGDDLEYFDLGGEG